MSFASAMSEAINGTSFLILPSLVSRHPDCSMLTLRKDSITMTKSVDVITEIVRNPKHSFRKADAHAEKANRHRYERRKIKEFMKLGNWAQESPAI
jgi:hypothetical protein